MKTHLPLRCWVEIDLRALRHNVSAIANQLRRDTGIMAVVKADGYGHGIREVGRAIVDAVDWFCVANLGEALALRSELGEACKPILLLSPLTPDEFETAIRYGFSCTVSLPEEVVLFDRAAASLSMMANLHAVADTGMGRMGAPAGIPWRDLLTSIEQAKHCRLQAVATHFPSADEDPDFTKLQINQFREMIMGLDCDIHVSNSAGVIDFSDQIDYATLARPGLSIYGIAPDCQQAVGLQPAKTLKSRVILVREIERGATVSYGRTFVAEQTMRVASVAAGYGDGYHRHLSGSGAEVLIAGQRCPLLGRVTMDQIVVDVSHLGTVAAGDEVILFGADLPVTEIAEKAGTIPWEILTSITNRVSRVYINR